MNYLYPPAVSMCTVLSMLDDRANETGPLLKSCGSTSG